MLGGIETQKRKRRIKGRIALTATLNGPWSKVTFEFKGEN